ncbi:hypothetical protein E4T44_02808 [Aureobasidium sp. EXF-8845]|nr:hypothetical protein E4T44_02808 [Aureobasidium sp. EXF-8845]KAI4852675.1 hypothetical protein E4T45_04620 [Aureobasidium sp. EXF-8846]
MATLPPIDDVMKELQKIPMSNEQFERAKANILQSRADARSNEPILKIAAMTQKCVKDIKDRVAYIRERRARRDLVKEQKTIAFATALAERNKVKEIEKTTKQGQKTHKTRIEVWRDRVKQLAIVEKEPTSVILHQQNSSRQHTAKRPLNNNETIFFSPLAGTTSTPINKRLKTTAQNDSSSLVAPPTSSRKSIPWLSTRASMADEDIFGYEDCNFPDQGIRVTDQKIQLHEEKKKKSRTVHHKDNKNVNTNNHEYADEEINRDEDDANSEDSYDSELTELEQLLAVEMAMVGVMAFLIARNEEEMRY